MKLDAYQCDRCGKKFNYRQTIQGVGSRCVEVEWDLCNDCLTLLHRFMDGEKL